MSDIPAVTFQIIGPNEGIAEGSQLVYSFDIDDVYGSSET